MLDLQSNRSGTGTSTRQVNQRSRGSRSALVAFAVAYPSNPPRNGVLTGYVVAKIIVLREHR
jgi:hypothetical protein